MIDTEKRVINFHSNEKTCVYTDLKVHITPVENNTIALLYIFGCYDAFVEPTNYGMF